MKAVIKWLTPERGRERDWFFGVLAVFIANLIMAAFGITPMSFEAHLLIGFTIAWIRDGKRR